MKKQKYVHNALYIYLVIKQVDPLGHSLVCFWYSRENKEMQIKTILLFILLRQSSVSTWSDNNLKENKRQNVCISPTLYEPMNYSWAQALSA